MGLAGVKKRSKLSHDPNNTAWSKSTTNFGHKILSKQGWKPGDFLGAENATHSGHYTAANASHIRVLLREDNLGLGAKVGGGNAETFGLSMFAGLLGRLNGKSEEVLQKQQEAIHDVELKTYTGRKYGFMNFVSGGMLVGDKTENEKEDAVQQNATAVVATNSNENRKRKAVEDVKMTSEDVQPDKTKKRKTKATEGPTDILSRKRREKKGLVDGRKLEKDGIVDDKTSSLLASSGSGSEPAQARKEKKRKKEKGKAETELILSKSTSRTSEKTRLKEEKRARKEERRKRKEEKRRKRATKEASEPTLASSSSGDSEDTAATPKQQAYSGRQAVRQRYIQQKRLASMDPQALKEIFMLQAKAAA